MPELDPEVEELVQKIKEENPDMDKSTAIAIARDQLDLADPCQEGYTQVGMKTKDGREVPNCVPDEDVPDAEGYEAALAECPEGQVKVGDQCVPVEDVGTPPNILSSPRVLINGTRELAGKIERVEEGDNQVRYKNLKIISRGVWTDSASKTPTLYDPAELDVAERNLVNVLHDSASDSSQAGEIDPQSYYVEGTDGYADVVLDTDTPGGQFADASLQESLESNGQTGFKGPSIELRENDFELEDVEGKDYQKVVNGEISGLGLVGMGNSPAQGPAAKDTNFARQTQERAVAMSGPNAKAFYRQETVMEPDTIAAALSEAGIDTDDLSDDQLRTLGSKILEDYEDKEDDEDEEMAEGEDMEDDEAEDEDDMDMADNMDPEEMMSAIQALRERVAEMEDMMAADGEDDEDEEMEEMSEELAETKSELSELKDEKKELAERVKTLEDEPKDSKSLADGSDEDESVWANAESGITQSANGSFSR